MVTTDATSVAIEAFSMIIIEIIFLYYLLVSIVTDHIGDIDPEVAIEI